MSCSRIHSAARRYAELGWPAMPLHGIRDSGLIRCSCKNGACGSPGKHPRTLHGLKDATTDLEQIDAWWRSWPDANVGITTGPGSGLLVIDIDGAEGHETITRLQHDHGSLGATLWQRTGSGWHCVVRYPEGSELGNSARKLGPGVDTRGAGGYIVVPPSLHGSGNRYQWMRHNEPAPAPEWLVSLLTPPPPGPPPAPADTSSAAFGRVIDGIVRTATEAPKGQRNDLLFWAARKLGQHLAAGNLMSGDVYSLLLPAAARSGLIADDGERSAKATIKSGLERGVNDGAALAPA